MKLKLRSDSFIFFALLASILFAGASQTGNKNSTPEWLKEEKPERIKPYIGKNGLPDPYPQGPDLGDGVAGIDLWIVNNFIVHRKETADFVYGDYTPLKVNYKKGTLPLFEKVVEKYTAGIKSDREKAVVLLTKAMPVLLLHPAVPPLGKPVPVDRNASDEELLQSGSAWCNEQARVFVRMCQVAGIPARIVGLFFSDMKNSHCVAEFYADGKWSLADSSYFCVFPGKDGRLMSAAELHRPEGVEAAKKVYISRLDEVLKMSDKELGGVEARKFLIYLQNNIFEFGSFGVVNYALPK